MTSNSSSFKWAKNLTGPRPSMSLTNSTLKGRSADTRFPFQMATYCFSTPSDPIKSASGMRGTWYTFSGAFTLTFAPILEQYPSTSAEDYEVEAPEPDDLSSTSQRILHSLRVRAAAPTEEDEDGREANRQVLGRFEITAAAPAPAAGEMRASAVVDDDITLWFFFSFFSRN